MTPVTYNLKDYTGEPIDGCFYSEEIHTKKYPKDYLVEINSDQVAWFCKFT